MSGKTPAERLQNAWIKLQTDVNCYMDSDLDKLSTDKFPGIRQVFVIFVYLSCLLLEFFSKSVGDDFTAMIIYSTNTVKLTYH